MQPQETILDLDRSRATLVYLTLLAYALITPLVFISEMRLDHIIVFPFIIAMGLAVALASRFFTRKKLYLLRSGIEIYVCGFLLVLPESLAVYLGAHLKMPWADAQLAAMDVALGLDWRGMISFIDERAQLSATLVFAYKSFPLQLTILPLMLVLAGRATRAYQMISCSAVIMFIGAAIAIWFPAMGTHTYYGLDPSTLKNLDPASATYFIKELRGVHDDPDFVYSLVRSSGIQTFPSMHAAIAVLCAWAAWDVKLMRYPLLVFNILMGFSAMVVSNHYMVDVIAGVGVAGLGIALMEILRNKTSKTAASVMEDAARPAAI